jgi:hypothetical protein
MGSFRVGVATVDVTPPVGLPLLGNFRDDYAARGTHDPLCAKAMVFADAAGNTAARLVVDVCLLDRRNVAFIRWWIGEHGRVPPENVMIGATHTHSGPATCDVLDFDVDLSRYQTDIETLLGRAASAVVLAEENLADATLAVGRAREDRISFNRRLRRKDGGTQMNWEALQAGFDPDEIAGPWGPIDPEVLCLVVERQGRPAAAMVNFGLHPAILAGDNWLYSADYPGYLAEAMKRIVGDDFTCLLANGCCGNVNHVDYADRNQGRGFAMTQRVGYMLAAAAAEAIRNRTPVAGDRVAARSDRVTLDRIQITPEQRAWSERVLREAAAHPPEGQVDGLPDAYYAKTYLRMAEKQDEPDRVEIMTIRLGDVALVGLPGEIFCEFGMDIKRRNPARWTLVSELCGDEIGYVPTRESFAQGGYEAMPGSTFYVPGSGEKLADAAVGQVRRLFAAQAETERE